MSDEADGEKTSLELLARVSRCKKLAHDLRLDLTAHVLSIAEYELIAIAYGESPTRLTDKRRRKLRA